MAAAAAMMLSAIIVAHYYRKKKWWLKAHKALNLAAVGFALAGFAIAAIMVQSTGGPHFRVTHAIFGGLALLLLVIMPSLGFLIFRSKDKKKTTRLKTAHRWLGRLTATLIGAAAIAGLILVGIL